MAGRENGTVTLSIDFDYDAMKWKVFELISNAYTVHAGNRIGVS